MPYDVGKDPYTDQETGILKNKLGIKTQKELDVAEAEITPVMITTLLIENEHSFEDFGWDFLCWIHQVVFADIYEWAGQVRTIELSKGKTSFARADHIEASGKRLFKELQAEDYLADLDLDNFTQRLAHYYSEFNVLHPFREGNGRVIRALLSILAEDVGWHIAWENLSRKQNISASITAYNGDETQLCSMLHDLVEPLDPFWGQDPYEYISS